MMITVILADDHAILRDGLRYLLEAAGDIQIISMAANGQEAVEQARLHCPDVVAILSMHHTTEYVQRAIEAGAVGYLLKDSAGAELVAAIRALNDGKRYISKKVAGGINASFWNEKNIN